MRKIFLLTTLLIFSALSKGQDIHFSQFNWSYLNLNPALIGSFEGDYRYNANFKNQWAAISEPYQTFSFAADANSQLKSYKGINLGALISTDEAGAGGLRTSSFSIGASHGFAINPDSSWALHIGAQLGMVYRSINFEAFSFDQQYSGTQFDPNRNTGENFDRNSYTNFTANFGFAMQHRISERKSLSFGAAAFNLNAANQSFLDEKIPLDRRYSFHAEGDLRIGLKVDALPSILASFQGKYSEILIGSNFRYRLLSAAFQKNLYGGFWYRNQDALILSVGMDYYQWKVGMSYDINLSDLDEASDKKGGLEIAVVYIIQNFKPLNKRYKRCPRFL